MFCDDWNSSDKQLVWLFSQFKPIADKDGICLVTLKIIPLLSWQRKRNLFYFRFVGQSEGFICILKFWLEQDRIHYKKTGNFAQFYVEMEALLIYFLIWEFTVFSFFLFWQPFCLAHQKWNNSKLIENGLFKCSRIWKESSLP